MAKDNQGASESVLMLALKEAFPFFKDTDNMDASIPFEHGSNVAGNPYVDVQLGDEANNSAMTSSGRASDRLHITELPKGRFERYAIFKEMEEDATMAAATQLHLSHAFSVPTNGGDCVYLHPKSEQDAEYVARLNREVVAPIAKQLMNWSYPALTYGVNYVRPYVEVGKGITHFESNYFTLPHNIREYERSGQLAGFTSEHLRERQDGEQVRLAEPWTLIPIKMPFHRPDMNVEPTNYTGEQYSLYSDAYNRKPMETQNYGTSLFHSSFEAWNVLRQSIAALGASRINASLIDRLITANTDGLDAARAAEYINMVATQLQQDRQQVVTKSQKTGILPTVMNSIIPVLGGAKGGINIDTFTTDPNISHIEDIMFNLKRLCGTLGLDPAMLGFGDLLAGGLGEGGFFRTSLQAALVANHLRSAAATSIQRAIDIHTIHRDGKVWRVEDAPFEIKFHSINTAVQQEQDQSNESRANYATMLATALDMIENSPIGQSGELKNHFYTSLLEMDAELSKKIIAELASKTSENDAMMESLGMNSRSELQRYVNDTVLDLLNNLQA